MPSRALLRHQPPLGSRAFGRLAGLAGLASLALTSGCGDFATLPVSAGTGPQPSLPAPRSSWVPTIDIAPAVGWPAAAMPQAAAGLRVTPYARGLAHPRWLAVLPNGDVLVAESNAPERPEAERGFKAWATAVAMRRAGAGVPSADRITLLRDADGDGLAEQRSVLLAKLHSPFGMALVDRTLYVANADALVAVPYASGALQIREQPRSVLALPAGLNHHWTKNVVASPDGQRLYVSVGSNSNIGENGLDAEQGRAAVWEVDPATGASRLYASGLRNPNGMAFEPTTGRLWTVVNERDGLGSDLVPDYLTAVQDGAFYGWPWSYFGAHVDPRVQPPRPDRVAQARVPDYALGPHTASLGLAWSEGRGWPADWGPGMSIGQHGSWNRKPPSGYRVIFVPFRDGRPNGPPREVLSGFLNGAGEARGRPVGVAIDRSGALLVADDVGDAVWRVEPLPGR